MDEEITVTELKAKLDAGEDLVLVDVREAKEWDFCRIEGAILIPLNQLPYNLDQLDPSREIVLQCRSGQRSMTALRYLRDAGYSNLKNLKGGILAWSHEIDPTIPTY